MKTLRKILSVAVSLMMVFSLMTVVKAADTTITLPSNGHTYAVYQIMTGDLSKNSEDKDVLSNVVWGSSAKKNGSVSESDMSAVSSIKGSDSQKAEEIANYVDLSKPMNVTPDENHQITVPTGYYLIQDKGPAAVGEGLSLFVVKVVGPTTITPKAGTTTSDKKVKDDEGANTDWNDSADYDIGDSVPFKLSATIAADYANYPDGYKLTFHDNQSAGLTFKPETVEVFVGNTKIESGYDVVTQGLTDGCTFEVRFANLKNITAVQAGSVISVEYESELNTNAKIGAEGNPNTSHITFTNNPNWKQEGTPDNPPTTPPEDGRTPDDTVIVFTYEVNVNKYANSVAPENKLAGAEFTLTKDGKEITVVKLEDGTSFNFKGLDAGTYVLTETKTPAGYNTIAPITIVITAAHDTEADAPKLNSLLVTPDDSFTVEMTEATETENAKPTGTITGNVINKAGSTLPETGGMGTTMLYVGGSVLMLGAAILLISKKRMSTIK